MSAGPTDVAELDQVVIAAATTSRFSGAVRVDLGSEHREWAFGEADRRWHMPFTTVTPSSVASGAKGVTAIVVLRLAELGVLPLHTMARAVLGADLPLIDDGVTVEHLLAHRSGIGDYLDETTFGSITDHVMPEPLHHYDDVEAYLPTLDGHAQVTSPGDAFAYNNGGFAVLAVLAQRAAGTRFRDLVTSLVCEPAGLRDTTFHPANALPEGVATGYLHADGMATNSLHLPLLGTGDGGLFTTVGDVRRLWTALFGGALLREDSVASMTKARSTDADGDRYGLGLWLAPHGPAVRLEGYDAGVSFRTWHDPGADITQTVIGNWSDAAWPVCRALRSVLGP
ncbi:MAG: beta-lactamase family protein [Ilumatobacter sp.]|nr:beta-lactamase family protein [Ilumatobacter sp.]MCB0983041.1 beta-lactamase family protein [Ilumatobacter sp.]